MGIGAGGPMTVCADPIGVLTTLCPLLTKALTQSNLILGPISNSWCCHQMIPGRTTSAQRSQIEKGPWYSYPPKEKGKGSVCTIVRTIIVNQMRKELWTFVTRWLNGCGKSATGSNWCLWEFDTLPAVQSIKIPHRSQISCLYTSSLQMQSWNGCWICIGRSRRQISTLCHTIYSMVRAIIVAWNRLDEFDRFGHFDVD